MENLYKKLLDATLDTVKNKKIIMFLTGAGISKSAGIPTFRDEDDGVWTIGSENYRPELTGTLGYFKGKPLDVWNWTLNFKRLCDAAQPTLSHHCIFEIEQLYTNNIAVVSQNIDGLDKRTGTKNVYEIHGNLNECRCVNDCTGLRFPYPVPTGENSNYRFEDLLCPACEKALVRPHTMYFDEKYNERFYHMDTVLKLAKKTGLIITIGTSGLTNLPLWIIKNALEKGAWLVNVDVKENDLSDRTKKLKKGLFLNMSSDEFLSGYLLDLKKVQVN